MNDELISDMIKSINTIEANSVDLQKYELFDGQFPSLLNLLLYNLLLKRSRQIKTGREREKQRDREGEREKRKREGERQRKIDSIR